MARMLPALAAKLCTLHDAWVIGSAAHPNADLSTVKDFDICVPFSNWKSAAALMPANATVNTLGGWKSVSEGAVVDVFPVDMGWLLTNADVKHIWHPRTGARFIRV